MTESQKTVLRRLARLAADEGRKAAEENREKEYEFSRGSLFSLERFAAESGEPELADEVHRMVTKLDRDWLLIAEEPA